MNIKLLQRRKTPFSPFECLHFPYTQHPENITTHTLRVKNMIRTDTVHKSDSLLVAL